jgi:hypothetical protein
MTRRNPLRILWHPHQKLWNRAVTWRIKRLFGAGALARTVETAVIAADSLLLAVRSRARRAARGAPTGARAQGRPAVLYIDCGVHKRAEQVQWMDRWFGEDYELHVLAFEAGGEHAQDAAAELVGLQRLRLHHLALVGPDHEGEEARLYKSPGKGKAD